jgi:hypothetical protein
MNIFVLDTDPVKAAKAHCDKHVVKMILETAQILCSAYPEGTAPYKRTHFNHPCCKWARASKSNYIWLLRLGWALHREYQYRYGEGKKHKSLDVISWCYDNINKIQFPQIKKTPFVQAMPDEYKRIDPVAAYKTYYMQDKKDILQYTKRKTPKWVSDWIKWDVKFH